MTIQGFAESQTEGRSQPIRRDRIPILFGLVLFLTVALIGCRSSEKEIPPQADIDAEPTRILGIGRIEPELKILEMTSEIPGIVQKIHHQAGGYVDSGDVIIELSNRVEQAKIAQASAKIRSQRSKIEASKAALSSTRIKTENARLSFERAKTLYEQNAQARFSFDDAKAAYESLLEDTKRQEAEVVVEQDMLRQYEADLSLARAELEKKYYRAPAGGQILSLDITLGSFIASGQSFGTFALESDLTAWCEIDELFAGKVEIGQKAAIRYQGTTEAIAEGKVTFVGPVLRKKSIFSDEVGDLDDRRIREVRIRLDPGARVLYGSRIECVIELEE